MLHLRFELGLLVDELVYRLEITRLEGCSLLLLKSPHFRTDFLGLWLKALSTLTKERLLFAAQIELLHHALTTLTSASSLTLPSLTTLSTLLGALSALRDLLLLEGGHLVVVAGVLGDGGSSECGEP
jgi:hypothetical protein